MKTKIFFIIVFAFVFGFRLWQTTGCQNFSNFYFNPLIIKIHVEEQRSLDLNINDASSRFFHNKASVGFFEFTKSYASVFNARHLLELLGPLGLVLIFLAIHNIFKKKKIVGFVHLTFILVCALLTILPINPKASFLLFALFLYSLLFWSIDFFIKNKKLTLFIIILIPITFWYFSFNWQMATVCNEIFFN